jgi:chemotaxis-related protein WspD
MSERPEKIPLTSSFAKSASEDKPTFHPSDGEKEERATRPQSVMGLADRNVVAAAEGEACWQSIGVYGSGNCRELQKFIHCRNCPVYSYSALRLLDRPLPPDYRAEWTEHFGKEQRLAPPVKTSAVLFRINAEWLALPTHAFQEVAERRRTHSLPHQRQGIVVGLVNIRGELLICVSLGRLLGLEKTSSRQTIRTAYDRLLVANWEGSRLVFPVDEVHGTHKFEASEVHEPPATVAKSRPSYTHGIFMWQQKPVGLLDPSLLFPALNRSFS